MKKLEQVISDMELANKEGREKDWLILLDKLFIVANKSEDFPSNELQSRIDAQLEMLVYDEMEEE